jgi:hypothetical protein
MKYRKLRIAWSVAWGVVSLLLIVLWVRSYWWGDYLSVNCGTFCNFYLEADDGELNAIFGPPVHPSSWIDYGSMYGHRDYSHMVFGFYFGGYEMFPDIWGAVAPFWFLVPAAAVVAAAPWVKCRFSLRTMLIAMSLVAVGLGLAVYLVGKYVSSAYRRNLSGCP